MSQDLITQIKIKLVEKKKNQAWLAKELNISRTYMSDIMNGRRSPEGQIEKIKVALDIKDGMEATR
ncbi:XRE family transcriptional regulator [Vagococcus fluvialis]|uniref:XRE family transcriptional regulator n=1 Tax=Vagococcus fluvialis TaxID=2738 RepID=UPI003B213E3A